MTEIAVHQLQNKHWQVGILPTTGASIAYGRVRYGGVWLDVMRPTAESDYGNASLSASFMMIPWSNRIRDGQFSYGGNSYQLNNLSADGTAIHGDVRKREWTILKANESMIRLAIRSSEQTHINFPFRFYAEVEYKLEAADFRMTIKLKSEDTRDFPTGFGFHPYFVRRDDVQIKIPCEAHYELKQALPTTGIPDSLPDRLEFRDFRGLDDNLIDDVFTSRIDTQPVQIRYPEWNLQLDYHADDLFKHFILFTPIGKPFFALEPVTNANDGFNLFDQGISHTGVFVLKPNQEKQASTRLHIELANHS